MEASGLMAFMSLLPFIMTKKGDLEQTMQKFVKYVKITGVRFTHSGELGRGDTV